jgi:CRISPR-associated endoribonuclease Cas6/Csy4 subtype I-F
MHTLSIRISEGGGRTDSEGLGVPVILGFLVEEIHRQLGQKKEKFALGFPQSTEGEAAWPGKEIEIHGSKKPLEELKKTLENDHRIEGRTKLGEIQGWPESPKKWACYQRKRTKSGRNKRPEKAEIQANRRMKSLEAVAELPYVTIQSRSTSQRFSLFWKKSETKEALFDSIQTDSYGLSKADTPTWLPVREETRDGD